MRKTAYFIFIFLLIPQFCFSYTKLDNDKLGTHYSITKNAINQSNIAKYLNDYLDIKLDDKFAGPFEKPVTSEETPSVREWIQYGGDWEDVPSRRALNHFYDPLTGYGWTGQLQVYSSALEWAKEPTLSNEWSWIQARVWYYTALKHYNEPNYPTLDSNCNFAKTFRSLGQVMHLLEDMAVPAHTRNDLHPDFKVPWTDPEILKKYQQDMYERYAALNKDSLPFTGYATVSINQFNQFDYYWHNQSAGTGLADFTNRNFLSRSTNIDDKKYKSPVATGEMIDYITIADPQDYQEPIKTVEVKYLTGKVLDYNLPVGSQVKTINHLATYSFFDFEMQTLNGERVYSLDDECHKDYASFLIPRAVGYSAGLINYFFRGTLKVTEALSIDGDDSGIKKITAKVINTSPNNEQQCEGKTNCAGKEYMSNGEVFAFARYKTGPNDNTTSYAVSGPAKDKDGADIKSIDYKTPAKMTFDFSNSPIPANAQELYLHVVYYGTLGNEADTGVAIGMDEVSKLYVLLRSGNNYTLYSVSTDSVVEKLKNPRYGNPLYPEAKEFFEFPEEGAQNSTDFGFYIENYLKETDSQDLLKLVPNYPEHDNDQDIIPAPYDNNTLSGTSCPNIPGGSGTYNISCAGSSKGRHYNGFNSGDLENHFFQIASPKDETVTYVSDYITSDSFNSGTWNNNYNGAFEWVIDPESCDSMPDGSQKCNCWIAALEQRPYAWSQTTNVSRDETLKGDYSVTRFTPLGKLYTIPFTNEDSANKQTSHDKIGQPFNTSKMCGWLVPSNRYSLTEVYYGDLVGVEYTNDVESTHTYGFNWGNDPYHFYSARVHLESNSLLHYYVSFPILEDITESQIAYKKVYVDHGYYVLAQLNVKDGLYDPLSKKFDVDYKNDWKENGKFEDAIKALIDFSLALTPTLKDFDAGFWIKK